MQKAGENQPAPRCDLCGHKDKKTQMNLCVCKVCNVKVHDRCHGMPYDQVTTDFTCWACQAVGRSFEVDDGGEIYSIKQKRRPKKCDLCGYDEGIHAMFPLFDYHGKSGRQIVMKDKPNQPRLSWGHALCCFYLSHKGGLVYGCNRGGEYGGDDEEEITDMRSKNPSLLDGYDSDEEVGTVHHFAYNLERPGYPSNDWIECIKQSQNNLKCIICGLDDHPPGVLRIPVQCCANNDDEYYQFKGCHYNMARDETCTVAMHVGCAKWKRNSTHKSVFYFPGSKEEGDLSEPVMELYCSAHAIDVARVRGKRIASKEIVVPAGVAEAQARRRLQRDRIEGRLASRNKSTISADARPGAKKRAADSSIQSRASRRPSDSSSTGGNPSTKRASDPNIRASVSKVSRASPFTTRRVTTASSTMSTLPKIPKRSHGSTHQSSHDAVPPLHPTRIGRRGSESSMPIPNLLENAAKQRPGKKKFEATKHDAVAPTNLARSRVASKKTAVAAESSKTRPLDAMIETMKKEMLPTILKATTPEQRKEYFKGQKAHWKRESSLPSDKFKEVWRSLKIYFEEQLADSIAEEKKRWMLAKKTTPINIDLTDDAAEAADQSEGVTAAANESSKGKSMSSNDDDDDDDDDDNSDGDDPPLISLMDVEDDDTPVETSGNDLVDPKRWDSLLLGPHYSGEFQFGEWDEMVELSCISR